MESIEANRKYFVGLSTSYAFEPTFNFAAEGEPRCNYNKRLKKIAAAYTSRAIVGGRSAPKKGSEK